MSFYTRPLSPHLWIDFSRKVGKKLWLEFYHFDSTQSAHVHSKKHEAENRV